MLINRSFPATRRPESVSDPSTSRPLSPSSSEALSSRAEPSRWCPSVGQFRAQPLRDALAEVVRQSMAEQSSTGLAPALTVIAFPLVPANFVGFIVAAFANSEDGAVWAVATLLIVAILLRRPIADAVRQVRAGDS